MTSEQRQILAAGLRAWADELQSGPSTAELNERLTRIEARLELLTAAAQARPELRLTPDPATPPAPASRPELVAVMPPWGTRAELIQEIKQTHWRLYKSVERWQADLAERAPGGDLNTCEDAPLEAWLSHLIDLREAAREGQPQETIVDRWARLKWQCGDSLKAAITRHMRSYLALGRSERELADLCGILIDRGFTPATLEVKSCQEICKDLAAAIRDAA